MTNFTATLNDAAKTDITVSVDENSAFVSDYGLVAAILEAVHSTAAYKAARKEEDASIHSIWIDGEEVTQF